MDDLYLTGERLNGRSGHEAGRALLASLYRQVTGEALPTIALTQQGKPYFPDKDWHFSITHTKKHVFCALAAHPVGIDAEESDRPIDLRLAEKILSPGERSQFDTAGDKHRALLTFWVLKEAAAKLSGKGLGSYLRDTSFSLEDPRVTQQDGCLLAVLQEKETSHAV